MTEGRRAKRVGDLIRANLVELLNREIDDPGLAAIVITDVQVPDDLATAWVQVRLMVGDDDARARLRAVRALKRSASRLRRRLAPRLELRRVPELRFSYDDGHDKTRRVEAILEEIELERKNEE